MRPYSVRTFLVPVLGSFILISSGFQEAKAQTVRVDISAGKAIDFDPDKAMGTSMDILLTKDLDAVYSDSMVKAGLSAGWGPITYRQNTELTYNAWHWNPNGKWSDGKHKSGYFVGDADPSGFLRESYGYRLTHRGTTRTDSGQAEYSRMTDGDPSSYWKSNPYLTSRFTGEPDSHRISMPSRLRGPTRLRPSMKSNIGPRNQAPSTSLQAGPGQSFRKGKYPLGKAAAKCSNWPTIPSQRDFCEYG